LLASIPYFAHAESLASLMYEFKRRDKTTVERR